MWMPKEIIVNEAIKSDPVTIHILKECKGIPVKYISNGTPKAIVDASEILSSPHNNMLDTIIAGKQVLYIAPPGTGVVSQFIMSDNRILCPHFYKVGYASNGCPYLCDWCFLKGTYRTVRPFIQINAGHHLIEKKILNVLERSNEPIIFNSGELADSLALEHLTGAGQYFIPKFGASEKGYLFMLTKSTNVDQILNLDHNGHTIIAWSMNNEQVSRKFEIGAPTFEQRLTAAKKVQQAGYPLRIRLDPIIPFPGWETAYAGTIKQIFDQASPDRITLGTLRFEKQFYNLRNVIFKTGDELKSHVDGMEPMFTPKLFPGTKSPKVGKYSYPEELRTDIFNFVITEVRKYSDCKIALCKESESVWKNTGLEVSRCSCVCQLDYADMTI